MDSPVLGFFTKIGALILSIIFAFSGIVSAKVSQQVKPKNEETVQFSFATMSDTHLTTVDAIRMAMLSHAFIDLDGKVDAISVVGDITDHGEREQYENFYKCVNKNVTESTLIPVVGNHDTWTENLREKSPTYEFLKAYNEYSGKKFKTPYYTVKVKGYTFIVISSEKDNTDAYISNKQIKWLDKEMAKAAKTKKPIFVLCHWPINGVCGQMEIDPEMVMGEQSDKVQKVLEKYKNVFYFCGHVHAGMRGKVSDKLFGNSSIETVNGVHYINLPCFTYINYLGWQSNNGGNLLANCGYITEVYKNEVVLRARDYVLGFYMPEYETTIKLVK